MRRPCAPRSTPASRSVTGRSAETGSRGSYPAIAVIATATSRTVRASGPGWSSDQESGTAPNRLARPNVGLRPTQPQSAAGMRMLPPVSLPSAAYASLATTATADPPDEPPGIFVVSHGLRTSPKCGFTELMPYANSCRPSLPRSTAPASRSLRTTVASSFGTHSARIRDPAVVRIPFVAKRSFTATGIPCSGPLYPPPWISRSAWRACSRARSAVTVMNAFRRGSSVSIRARHDSTSDTGEISRARIASAAASIVMRRVSGVVAGIDPRSLAALLQRLRAPRSDREDHAEDHRDDAAGDERLECSAAGVRRKANKLLDPVHVVSSPGDVGGIIAFRAQSGSDRDGLDDERSGAHGQRRDAHARRYVRREDAGECVGDVLLRGVGKAQTREGGRLDLRDGLSVGDER